MELEEEKYEFDNHQNSSENNIRNTLVMLSYTNDKIYTHINPLNTNIDKHDRKQCSKSNFNQNQAQSKLIDINATTRKINESEATKLAICSLLGNFEIENCDVKNIIQESGSDHKSMSSFNDEDDEDYGLSNRKKNQKLSHSQLIFIKQKIEHSGLCSKELSLKLRISISQINRIKRMNLNQIQEGPARNFIKLSKREKKVLGNTIKEYSSNSIHPFCARDLRDYVKCQFNLEYPVNFIRRFMKSESNLTFKKINPRPSSINFKKTFDY